MADETAPAVLLLNKQQAQELNDQIKTEYREMGTRIGELLIQMASGEGYKALGYKSFEDYIAEEFEENRASLFRYMQVARVRLNVGEALPIRQAAILARLPAEQQAAVIAELPKGERSAAAIAKAVERRKSKASASRTPKTSGWTKDELKDDEELSAAFDKLEKLWGKSDAEAIRKGVVADMTRKDVTTMVNLPRETLDRIHDLVMGNHWRPNGAISFMNNMPDQDSTVGDLMNWCLATKGKYETFDIDGYHISIKYVAGAAKR